jgi:hypothetical protein
MDDLLKQYNHTAYYYDDDECVLVVEDRVDVTAVSEIVPDQLALGIIKYNHRLLKGELETKKTILLSMGDNLEPQRKDLTRLNKQLCDSIFFMLNNCSIRHNNRSKKDASKYKEYVAKMSKKKLEKWYDELYQMMLLAFLLLDNQNRQAKICELKRKIVGGTTNVNIE